MIFRQSSDSSASPNVISISSEFDPPVTRYLQCGATLKISTATSFKPRCAKLTGSAGTRGEPCQNASAHRKNHRLIRHDLHGFWSLFSSFGESRVWQNEPNSILALHKIWQNEAKRAATVAGLPNDRKKARTMFIAATRRCCRFVHRATQQGWYPAKNS